MSSETKKNNVPLFSGYTDVYYFNRDSDKFIVINQGGSSCEKADTLIVTSKGTVPVINIKKGDLVKSYDESTKSIEFKKVTNVFEYVNNKPTVKVTLKNGETMTFTDDHKFYFQGEWTPLKDILCKLKK